MTLFQSNQENATVLCVFKKEREVSDTWRRTCFSPPGGPASVQKEGGVNLQGKDDHLRATGGWRGAWYSLLPGPHKEPANLTP